MQSVYTTMDAGLYGRRVVMKRKRTVDGLVFIYGPCWRLVGATFSCRGRHGLGGGGRNAESCSHRTSTSRGRDGKHRMSQTIFDCFLAYLIQWELTRSDRNIVDQAVAARA
jgi:hypothetical protein